MTNLKQPIYSETSVQIQKFPLPENNFTGFVLFFGGGKEGNYYIYK